MKKIDTQYAIDPVRQPFMARSVDHLQEAYQEAIDALAKAIIPDPTGVTILFGCEDTGTPPAVNISAGAVYYDGEVFLVDAASFTPTGANVAVASIVTTHQVGDPTEFSDGNPYNVHEIRKVTIAAGTSGSGIANFSDFKATGAQWVSISSGLTFKYVENGGSTLSIVASPTLTEFKYRIDGNLVTVVAEIDGIDTSTSNTGVGFSRIIIEGLPAAITPAVAGSALVVIGNAGAGNSYLNIFYGRLSGTTLTMVNSSGNTSWSATNSHIRMEMTFRI